MRIPFMKHLAWYLAVTMFILAVAPRVEAGLAPSEVIALTQTDRTEDVGKIQYRDEGPGGVSFSLAAKFVPDPSKKGKAQAPAVEGAQ